MSYLNVTEVESALAGLAQKYPKLCELVTLPNASVEGRTSHALRIGTNPVADGVLFTGCQHAREWGGAEICVYFAADLLEAYSAGTGLAYGANQFTSFTIRRIVERLSVVVFPCVNPDGRAFDQQYDALWRKNRNPASAGGNPLNVGVDLNRNHPFLWDFVKKFSPAARNTGTLASETPSDYLYHGPAAASEPEARNVHWLLDHFRFTRWYLDIHSFTGDVLFPWGDDENQTVDPSMSFLNATWDGQRGDPGVYREYLSSKDLTVVVGTANRVTAAINAVRGGHYRAVQSVSLALPGVPPTSAVSYPVSGGVDDYAFGRHRADCTKGKVYAFALEFGYWRNDYRDSFHPVWPEMEQIVGEIDAGMLELCAAAAPQFKLPWEALFRRLWPWQIWDPMIRAIGRLVGPRVQRGFAAIAG
jgi:murein tripeptide amidase MpaA